MGNALPPSIDQKRIKQKYEKNKYEKMRMK
jgi:hypothetical protein